MNFFIDESNFDAIVTDANEYDPLNVESGNEHERQKSVAPSNIIKIIRRRLKRFFGNPFVIVPLLDWKHRFIWIPDIIYLLLYYRAHYGKWPNLEQPRLYSEKLQYLKLNYRKPQLTELVDKLAVREFVRKAVGSKYLIPLLGTWTTFDDIPFDQLPHVFVIKCNHDSGGYYICDDKTNFNRQEARTKINEHLSRNYYWGAREWPYKNVKPCVMVEQFISNGGDDGKRTLTDYKFYSFDGVVHTVMVCTERETGSPKVYFYSQDWQLLRINVMGVEASQDFTMTKPLCLDEMFMVASKLSVGLPFVRVDFYAVDGSVYFGEMTLLPMAGFSSHLLEETDELFGSMIDIDKYCKYTN